MSTKDRKNTAPNAGIRLVGAALSDVLTPDLILTAAAETLQRAGVDLLGITHERRVALSYIVFRGVTITSASYSQKRRAYQLAVKGEGFSGTMHLPVGSIRPDWQGAS